MANIYDGAFRTILNDCRKLIIPVINEIFGETYTGEEEIQFFPNEHFIDQQDEADKERITDTNFTVFGKIPKKYHIECESSLPDGRIMIRLFEYDAQIALDEGEVTEETLTVTFPNTAVLYLRTYKKTPDKMKYVIKEIAQKYENVQKVVGNMMRGALIETSARTILSQGISRGINQAQKETTLRMLQDGELSVEKIARYSGLRIKDVERLAELQTV